jgi:Spy/CpxP family protein refolding chaperone
MKTALLVLLSLWSIVTVGQPADQAAGPGRETLTQHVDHLAILLDLTDAQKAQVQAVLQQEHDSMKAQMEQARASGQRPSFEQMKAQHTAMKQDTLAKLTPVLSPEQLKKLQVLMDEHGGPGGPHGHRGPPPAPQ